MAKDKTYTVRWYGPFEDVEDIKDFEKKNKSVNFQLYILDGYKPHAKIYSSYYCGQTQRGVYDRLTDPGHHINELKYITSIWIGSISNVDPEHGDINVVENIVTAQLRSLYGENYMLNKINKNFPKYNSYVINIWHNLKGERIKRYKKYSIPAELPDVIGHEYDKEFDAHLLFSTSRISWTNVE